MNAYQRAVDVFGHDAQVMQAAAEMSELSAALLQYLSHPGKRKQRLEEVLEGIPDAEIMLKQLRILFGDHSNKLNSIKREKVERLNETLDRVIAERLEQSRCKGEHELGRTCDAMDRGTNQYHREGPHKG